MEYLIRNGAVKEECYLKDVSKGKPKAMLDEFEFGRTPNEQSRKKGQKWEWSCVRDHSEETPKGFVTATWTKDETQALYFPTRAAAEKLIKKYSVLRNAVIVEAEA